MLIGIDRNTTSICKCYTLTKLTSLGSRFSDSSRDSSSFNDSISHISTCMKTGYDDLLRKEPTGEKEYLHLLWMKL